MKFAVFHSIIHAFIFSHYFVTKLIGLLMGGFIRIVRTGRHHCLHHLSVGFIDCVLYCYNGAWSHSWGAPRKPDANNTIIT